MAIKRNISVNQKDYEQFLYTANRNNKILKFWIEILHSLPVSLLKESRRKPTSLILQSKSELENSIKKSFQFKTKGASEPLAKYIEQFNVFVEQKKIKPSEQEPNILAEKVEESM